MNRLLALSWLSAFVLPSVLVGKAFSSVPLSPRKHFFAGTDLRLSSEVRACEAIKSALGENSTIEPIDFSEDCLGSLLSGFRDCDTAQSLMGDSPCSREYKISLKNIGSSVWQKCSPRQVLNPSPSGSLLREWFIGCGAGLRLSGSIPSISSLVRKSQEAPVVSESYGLALDVSNSRGETDRAYPLHVMAYEISVDPRPIMFRENLTEKYYFPVKIFTVSKYRFSSGGDYLYLRAQAQGRVMLGSKEKNLIE